MSAHTIRISNTTEFQNVNNNVDVDVNAYSRTYEEVTVNMNVVTNGSITSTTTIDFGDGVLGAILAFLTKLCIIRNRNRNKK